MYLSRSFEETRLPVLHDLMHAAPFATLVTMGASGLVATHLPVVLKRDVGEFGTLQCHLSRANTQWKDFNSAVEALVIFAGPHYYITPSWYPEKAATGKTVPTWNYTVVHAYGTLRVMDDGAWLQQHLSELTDRHEGDFSEPWKITDAPADYIETLKRGIVGLEITISRLEGKWKLNQNRNDADREGVIEGLGKLNTPESLAVQSLMKDRR